MNLWLKETGLEKSNLSFFCLVFILIGEFPFIDQVLEESLILVLKDVLDETLDQIFGQGLVLKRRAK